MSLLLSFFKENLLYKNGIIKEHSWIIKNYKNKTHAQVLHLYSDKKVNEHEAGIHEEVCGSIDILDHFHCRKQYQ
jgi:hypothetical protein